MMKSEELIKKINHLLTFHAFLTTNLTSQNLNDQALLSEDLYRNICNIIFGIDLTNTNAVKKNHDTIDLKDKVNGIAIQITANTTREKINTTIEKFIEKKYYKEYKSLHFIVMSNYKREDIYKKGFDTKNKFDFSIENNIFLVRDLINLCKTLDIESLERLLSEVEKYFQLPVFEKMHESKYLTLWEHVYRLSQSLNDCIEPDITATKKFEQSEDVKLAGNYHLKLKEYRNKNKVFFDIKTINDIDELLSNASNTLDCIRRSVNYKKEGKRELHLKHWEDAREKNKSILAPLLNIENLIREKTINLNESGG